jgi:hypothetical protein
MLLKTTLLTPHPQLRQAILRLIAARLPSGVTFGPFLMAAPPPGASEDFGPFLAVGSQLIQPAGWKCKGCGKPVRVLKQVVPVIVERLMIYACDCGASVHWESEINPTRKSWPFLMEMLKGTGCQIAICNSGKDTPPGFQGTN